MRCVAKQSSIEGVVNRTTGNMAWAEFIHTTSRPVDGIPDPQLHAHVFVFNTTFDLEEDRWKAGQFRELKRDAPYFQAAFRVRLAGKLQELGFGVERKKDDFEIAGIPADVLGRYSRRTALIEQKAAELGITDPDRKGELGAETREKKAKTLGWDGLRKEWNGRLSNEEREALAAVHRREVAAPMPEPSEAKAVDYAIEHSFVREAVIPERKLLTEALKRGIGEVTVERTAKVSTNASEHYEAMLKPNLLMNGLRTGGKANNLICDAVVIRSGEPFSDGKNWLWREFSQQ